MSGKGHIRLEVASDSRRKSHQGSEFECFRSGQLSARSRGLRRASHVQRFVSSRINNNWITSLNIWSIVFLWFCLVLKDVTSVIGPPNGINYKSEELFKLGISENLQSIGNVSQYNDYFYNYITLGLVSLSYRQQNK